MCKYVHVYVHTNSLLYIHEHIYVCMHKMTYGYICVYNVSANILPYFNNIDIVQINGIMKVLGNPFY
jgi:hypothetical protein